MPALTRCSQVEEVPDGDGDAVAHGRQGGSGVQHIGSKVRQLPGFVIAEAGEANRLGHLAGVCTVHPVHVSPDGDLAGLKECADCGGRIVASVTLQSRDLQQCMSSQSSLETYDMLHNTYNPGKILGAPPPPPPPPPTARSATIYPLPKGCALQVTCTM